MPVEKLKEETTGGEEEKTNVATPNDDAADKPDKDSESQTGKDAPTGPAATAEKPGLLARFSSKKKADDPFRFQGEGVDYKGKLIGIQEVGEARGDKMCQEAIQVAKALVKASGQHKQRILLNISLQGIKIKDEKTGNELYQFPVSKISFIARDVTDARAFGFVYGTPESKHKFYGIKTAQTADQAVLAIRDMFHIVYEVKKKQLAEGKDRAASVSEPAADKEKSAQESPSAETNGGGAIADLLNLEEEVAGLEQGMGNQDWATFEATAAAHAQGATFASTPYLDAGDFNKSDLFTSSTGSSVYPATTDGDTSGGDPFGASFNTTVSSSGSGPTAAVTATPMGNPYAALSGLDLGGGATPVQANFPPPANQLTPQAPAATDPFDTSHVTQGGLGSLLDGPAPGGLEPAAMGGGLPAAEEAPPAAAAAENPLAGLTSPAGIDDALGKLTADLMGGAKKSPVPGMASAPASDQDKLSPFQRAKQADKKPMGAMMGGAVAPTTTPKTPLDIGQLYAQQPPMAPMAPVAPMVGGGATNPFLAAQQPQPAMQTSYSAGALAPGQPNPFAAQPAPAFAAQSNGVPSAVRPRPSAVPATGNLAIGDPFNDPFFK